MAGKACNYPMGKKTPAPRPKSTKANYSTKQMGKKK